MLEAFVRTLGRGIGLKTVTTSPIPVNTNYARSIKTVSGVFFVMIVPPCQIFGKH